VHKVGCARYAEPVSETRRPVDGRRLAAVKAIDERAVVRGT